MTASPLLRPPLAGLCSRFVGSPRLQLRPSLALLLVALAALGGCNRTKKRECGEVIARINEGVKKNEAFEAERRTQQLDSTLQTAKQMAKLSDLYQELYASTSALSPTLTDKELKAELDEYAHQVKLASDGTHLLASGIEGNRPEQARQGDGAYASAVEKQKQSIAKINDYCAR